jgi:hypothetical protein
MDFIIFLCQHRNNSPGAEWHWRLQGAKVITHVSEKETRLAYLLREMTEALDRTTKERDALRLATQAGLDALTTCHKWTFGGTEYQGYSEDSVEDAITQLQAALKGKS